MATLKSLVNETTYIKNELVACHTNLKNTLIKKGVECSEDDKMSSLVDKINSIGYKASIGNTDAIYGYHGWVQFFNTSFASILDYTSKFDGAVTVQFGLRSNNGGCISTAEVRLNNTKVKSFETTTTHVIGLDCQVELNIKKGDIINIYVKKNSSNSSFGGELSFPIIKCTLSN